MFGLQSRPRMKSAMSSPLSVRECRAPHGQPPHSSVYVRPAMMARISFRTSVGAAVSGRPAAAVAVFSGVWGHFVSSLSLVAGLDGGMHRLVRMWNMNSHPPP